MTIKPNYKIIYADYIKNERRYYRGYCTILDDIFIPVVSIYRDKEIHKIQLNILVLEKILKQKLEECNAKPSQPFSNGEKNEHNDSHTCSN